MFSGRLRHTYQRITEIISTGIFGLLFVASGESLWMPIIAHGVDYMVGFVAIFAGFDLV